MSIFKIVGIGLASAVLAVLVKGYRAELGLLISIASSVLIFSLILPYIKSIMTMLSDLSAQSGTDLTHVAIVIKIIGAAYITQLGAELCRDAGENAVASKVELGGKIIIAGLSMPIVYSLLDLMKNLMSL